MGRDAILSLAHPKVRILDKLPNTKELHDDHKFRINPKFDSKLMKVQVPTIKCMDEAGTKEKKNCHLLIFFSKTDEEEDNKSAINLQRSHQYDIDCFFFFFLLS